MKIIENSNELVVSLEIIRKKGKKIGLIPTMGAIHKGHLSLVRRCKKLNYFTLISIFVNPTQFNELKDYTKYPKNIFKDINEINAHVKLITKAENELKDDIRTLELKNWLNYIKND